MKIEFSLDDGSKHDVMALALLMKHGFADRTTFYIPTVRELSDDEVVFISQHAQIGGHTVTHPMDLKLLTGTELMKEIGGNKTYLEDLIQRPITSFCYPRGRYNDDVKVAVRFSGFKEARTTRVLQIFEGSDPYEKHTTIHMMQREEYEGMDWLEVAETMLEQARKMPDKTCFHVWGHSWELEKNQDWPRFEKLLEILSNEE